MNSSIKEKLNKMKYGQSHCLTAVGLSVFPRLPTTFIQEEKLLLPYDREKAIGKEIGSIG